MSEVESFWNLLSVLGAAAGACALRAVVPAWVYDALALVGLLSPLLCILGLTYVGMGLPPLADMSLSVILAIPAILAGCVAVATSGIPFSESTAIEGHLRTGALSFGFIVVIAALTEPESLLSLLTMLGVVTAAVAPAALCPRLLARACTLVPRI